LCFVKRQDVASQIKMLEEILPAVMWVEKYKARTGNEYSIDKTVFDLKWYEHTNRGSRPPDKESASNTCF
jgi:anaerobic selenocysteine-containing dehydrogenase